MWVRAQTCIGSWLALAANQLPTTQDRRHTMTYFCGACGVEHCAECLPLFDTENQEIPNTTTAEGVAAFLAPQTDGN
jgi:hypothetical protein